MARKSSDTEAASDTEATATEKPPRSRVAGAVRADRGKQPPRPGKNRGAKTKGGGTGPDQPVQSDPPAAKGAGRPGRGEAKSARAASTPSVTDDATAAGAGVGDHQDDVVEAAAARGLDATERPAPSADGAVAAAAPLEDSQDDVLPAAEEAVVSQMLDSVGLGAGGDLDHADATTSTPAASTSDDGAAEPADGQAAAPVEAGTIAEAPGSAEGDQPAAPVMAGEAGELATAEHGAEQEHIALGDEQAPATETLTAGDLLHPEAVQALEFAVKQQDLKLGVAAVVALVPSKTTLPVLQCIAITADEPDHIRLTATDLDSTVTFRIPAVVAVQGAVLVSGKKLNEIAGEIPDSCVLRFVLEETAMKVRCDKTRTKYRLPTVPFEEFPPPPGILWEDHGFAVSSADLGLLIGRTLFAASTEETRPILNGVLWEFGADEMAMVATNGHRLSSTRLAAADTTGRTDVIIHPRALAQITRLGGEGEIRVARTDNHVGFRGEGWELITRTIEGPYPEYRNVIPTGNDKAVRLDMVAFRGALRRMAIVTSDLTHRIKMEMGYQPHMMRISVETPDVGTASEEVPVTYEGEPLAIGFNVQYLLEFLRYTPPGEVQMTFKGPEGAAILEPLDDDSGAATQMLVMPLRLLS